MSVETEVDYLGEISVQHLTMRVEDGGMALGDGDREVLLDDEVGSKRAAAEAWRRLAASALARAEMLDAGSPDRNRGWT